MRLTSRGSPVRQAGRMNLQHFSSADSAADELQNDFAAKDAGAQEQEDEEDDEPSFTEITLDVKH